MMKIITFFVIVIGLIALSEQKKYITATVGDVHFVYENDVCRNGVKTFCDDDGFSLVKYSDKDTCENQVGSITVPNLCKNKVCKCTNDFPKGYRLVFHEGKDCTKRKPETIVIDSDLCFSLDTLLIDFSVKFEIDDDKFVVSAYLDDECEENTLVTVEGKLKQCSVVQGQSFILSSGYRYGISSFLVFLSLFIYMIF